MIDKYCLGTAQFGLKPYGFNKSNFLNINEIYSILDYSLDKGVEKIDTSPLYGEVEKLISSYNNKKLFKIFSKVNINSNIDKILKNLKIGNIEGCFIHSFNEFSSNPHLYEELTQNKNQGKINKIGFSLYNVEELDYLLEQNLEFDIVQIPYNLMDRRFEKYFSILKNKNIEIFIRSIYLQGLFFANKSDRKIFELLSSKLQLIRKYSKDTNTPIPILASKFCIQNNFIDNIVLGVDNFTQNKENIDLFSQNLDITLDEEFLKQIRENNPNLISIPNWKKYERSF